MVIAAALLLLSLPARCKSAKPVFTVIYSTSTSCRPDMLQLGHAVFIWVVLLLWQGVAMQEMASKYLEELHASERDGEGKLTKFTKVEKDRRKADKQRAEKLFDEGVKMLEIAESFVLRKTQVWCRHRGTLHVC